MKILRTRSTMRTAVGFHSNAPADALAAWDRAVLVFRATAPDRGRDTDSLSHLGRAERASYYDAADAWSALTPIGIYSPAAVAEGR